MSVYCGHCGDYGHNAPHCPRTKDRAAEYERKIEAGEATNYRERWAFRYRERIDEAQANRSRSRVCGYCKGSGHNRATCPDRLGDVQLHIKAEKHYRRFAAKFLRDEGLGVGALISVEHSYYDQAGQWREYRGPAIVQAIIWERFTLSATLNIGERHKALLINVPPVGSAKAGIPKELAERFSSTILSPDKTMGVDFYDCFHKRAWIPWESDMSLLSPSTTAVPPSGWLQATDIHPKKFCKGKDESEILSNVVNQWGGNGYEKFIKAKTDNK